MKKNIVFTIDTKKVSIIKKSARAMYEDFGTSYNRIRTCLQLSMTLGEAVLATADTSRLIEEVQAMKLGINYKAILKAADKAKETRSTLLKNRPMFTYMARNKDSKTGNIKVGVTQNWNRRLKTFKTFSENGVELIELLPIPQDTGGINDRSLRDFMFAKGFAKPRYREDGTLSEFVEYVDKSDYFTTKDCLDYLVVNARIARREVRTSEMN